MLVKAERSTKSTKPKMHPKHSKFRRRSKTPDPLAMRKAIKHLSRTRSKKRKSHTTMNQKRRPRASAGGELRTLSKT